MDGATRKKNRELRNWIDRTTPVPPKRNWVDACNNKRVDACKKFREALEEDNDATNDATNPRLNYHVKCRPDINEKYACLADEEFRKVVEKDANQTNARLNYHLKCKPSTCLAKTKRKCTTCRFGVLKRLRERTGCSHVIYEDDEICEEVIAKSTIDAPPTQDERWPLPPDNRIHHSWSKLNRVVVETTFWIGAQLLELGWFQLEIIILEFCVRHAGGIAGPVFSMWNRK